MSFALGFSLKRLRTVCFLTCFLPGCLFIISLILKFSNIIKFGTNHPVSSFPKTQNTLFICKWKPLSFFSGIFLIFESFYHSGLFFRNTKYASVRYILRSLLSYSLLFCIFVIFHLILCVFLHYTHYIFVLWASSIIL